MSKERICFFIAPIGEPDSDSRKRSDQILRFIIIPAAKECGYKSIRADQISEPGIITSQVIQHIVEDPLVIADLTGQNPNVFYELAIRHAIKKPLVQIIKKGETIPFDVAATRTIQVDHHDLYSVEEAKSEIVRQIVAVEKDASQIDNPISVALDLQKMRQSDNPEKRSLADLISAISDLRAGFTLLEKKICDPKCLLPPDYIEFLYQRICRQQQARPPGLQELRVLLKKLTELADKEKYSLKTRGEIRDICHQLLELTNYVMNYEET